MIVSVTEVASFKRCRRQWDLGSFNRQGMTPIIQPKPYLDLGTMLHKSLAFWTANYNNDSSSDLERIFVAVASHHRKTIVDKYTSAIGSPPPDEDMEPILDAIVLGQAMMRNYQEYYSAPLPDHLAYCSPEQEVLIPIPDTEHPCPNCVNDPRIGVKFACNTCDSTGIQVHYLKARFDALAQDTHENLYVIEHKSYDKRPDLNLLERTDQFVGYVWVAQQMVKEVQKWQSGQVIGIAYDGMWKRATPPQRPKKLEIADLFCRAIIEPSQDEINEYGVEIARTVQDMANDPYIYKNRVWSGCWDCSFERLCSAMSQNDDVESLIQLQYTKRTEDDVEDIAQQVGSVA